MERNKDKDVAQYGEPFKYDRTFKGPLNKNRSCTDVLCLLIFVVFLGCWGYVAHYAITNGDLHKILVPTDSQNRKCGLDSGVLKKPYLFFFNLERCIDPLVPITGCRTPQVCVEECPNEVFIYNQDVNRLTMEELKKKLICQTDLDYENIKTKEDAQFAIDHQRCAQWYVKSKPFLNRCVWEFASNVCPLIPKSLFQQRSKREISDKIFNITKYYEEEKSPLRSYGLLEEPYQYNTQEVITTTTESAIKSSTIFPAGLEVYDQKKKPVDEPVCEIRRILNDEVIIQKVKETDTYLARFVGNFVAHFYPGENPQEFGQQVVEDIINSWPTIFIALLGAMIVSLIFIALMRWIAAPVVWFSMLGAIVALGVGVYFCVIQYLYWRDNPNVGYHSPNLQAQVKSIFEDKNLWLTLSIVVSVILLIIILLVIFLRKRIVIAIALVKEGSKAVSCVISSVFFPIFPWALQILTIAFAIAVGLYLASIGEASFRVVGKLGDSCICGGPAVNYKTGGLCNPTEFSLHCGESRPSSSLINFFHNDKIPCTKTGCYFEKITNPPLITYFHIYNVIGLFWLAFFISALGQMVLAGTFAQWYWTFRKSDVPYFTTTNSLCRTIRYHLGTLAFGSLILTICRLIRLVLEYIDTQLKKYDNAFTRAILCCMKCFFWCLESFLRFLNKNAYIMCAIHGDNFCSSAKDAFNLLMRNFLRVVTLDKVTDFLFFLSKLLLTIAAGAATFYYAENYYQGTDKLHYNGVPTTIVVIGTYLITSIFFGVYSMAVDTLFLCFLEDCERNDGSEEKPYFMSTALMDILRKRNVVPRNQYR